ncbi:MAG: hypothetical protein HFI86_05620 [Bacilli bacterium]|nr:hypothetical protein [Bacilli bacterium]
MRRLDYRESQFGSENNNFSRAVRKDYYSYLEGLKNNPFPKEKIFFTINTEGNLDTQVDSLVKKIQEYIKTAKQKAE